MLGGIATYFFKGEEVPESKNEEKTSYMTKETEDDWLLVDIWESNALPSMHQVDLKLHSAPKNENMKCKHLCPKVSGSASLSVQLPERVELATTLPDSPVSPTQMDGSWYITPPPCFTARGLVRVETSPLENLLIEHPSMSVYGSDYLRVLSSVNKEVYTSRKTDAEKDETSSLIIQEDESQQSVASDTRIINRRTNKCVDRFHRRIRRRQQTSAVTMTMDILEFIENVKPAQRARKRHEQKQLQKSYLDRQNQICHMQASVKHPPRKDHLMHHSRVNNKRKS
ncbi:tumor protein p53-inducible nuclear protein 1-like [Limulus polyphemus]|uniref:Tumor protein p53-inducible nuclear protein 1-like n=1 Tax=Limulus polyphemus TaxID=6850 RepID=A0ABM1SXJ6_LIMPO|nr:tumor protein p53-inducible nuclear protein 1-like [Limulus polyphemus]XP_022248347.1 tumor protein p53-inducible nuclear protein 1-like [Limulus polyphemus]XP_022248352.1 tumor protein p53-inducible nuclear protein 1-like [Limulus polyphemus]